MSFEALNWVRTLPLKDATARYVLYMLADRADEKDTCFPSIKTLVENTSLSEKAVRNAIKRLADSGLIAVQRIRKKDGSLSGNRYTLLLSGAVDQPQDQTPVQTQDVVGGQDGQSPPPASGTGGEADFDQRHVVPSPAVPEGAPAVPGTGPYMNNHHTEPSREPSQVRESAQARGDGSGDEGSKLPPPKSGVAQDVGPPFKRFWQKWLNRGVDSKAKAQSEWAKLDPTQREVAIAGIVPFHEAMKRAGRRKLPAAATYLAERKWEDLDTPADSAGTYLPPEIPPYSALWSAAMIELLRTGLFARKRFVFSNLCKGEATNLSFGRERDGELAAAADQFTKAKAQSDKGRAFVGWLETHMAANRLTHQMPRFRDDFWLYVPPPDLAKAWGLAPERSGEARSDAPIDTPAPAIGRFDTRSGDQPGASQDATEGPGQRDERPVTADPDPDLEEAFQ